MKLKIRLDGNLSELDVKSDQSILDCVLESGLTPPYSCESGMCGMCKAKLIDGRVGMDEDQALSVDEKAHNFILTCQAKAKSDVFIDYDVN